MRGRGGYGGSGLLGEVSVRKYISEVWEDVVSRATWPAGQEIRGARPGSLRFLQVPCGSPQEIHNMKKLVLGAGVECRKLGTGRRRCSKRHKT